MRQFSEDSNIIRFLVTVGDFFVLAITAILMFMFFSQEYPAYLPRVTFSECMTISFLSYLGAVSVFSTVVHKRLVPPESIVRQVLYVVTTHFILNIISVDLLFKGNRGYRFFILFYTIFFILLVLWRMMCRLVILTYRKKGGNTRQAVFVGAFNNAEELYSRFTKRTDSGYRITGVFDDEVPAGIMKENYAGKVSEVIPFLEKSRPHELFCCLPSVRAGEIYSIIDYCENNMIRFYSVPNVRNYLRREMKLEIFDNIPVLSIREEPLALLENRFFKRSFDIIVSGLFLFTLYPFILLIVGAIIKITSPGPVYFKQERTGFDGRIFKCIKFRSMKVNVESDKTQATANDPRKTRFGNFMRRTSIDELPQFINVLKGDMSVVGPRPHMLKHTDEYSSMINKFMVRHLVKPGITGWAQVTGFRGETKELSQMEGRVQQDIWYIENWSLLLDIRICIKTVKNALGGDKQAY